MWSNKNRTICTSYLPSSVLWGQTLQPGVFSGAAAGGSRQSQALIFLAQACQERPGLPSPL